MNGDFFGKIVRKEGTIMYKSGDMIIYGNSGVCVVQDITKMNHPESDTQKMYYVLKPLYETYTISTPVDNDKVLMRPVISRREAERLIDIIPTIQAEAYSCDSMGDLTRHYEALIRTYDGEELIRLTMSIYSKNQSRVGQKLKPGAIEKRYLKRAEDLLFGEFAVALGIPREEVPDYIEAKIETA
jgi:CarD family transcriptional regulator